MKPRRPDDRRVSKALAVLDPPPANREKWAETIQSVLYPSSPSSPLGYVRHHFDEDDIPFERDRAGLTRYIAALRELKASRAALDPSTCRFLTLGEETVTFPFWVKCPSSRLRSVRRR
jgi:hypothetical protein